MKLCLSCGSEITNPNAKKFCGRGCYPDKGDVRTTVEIALNRYKNDLAATADTIRTLRKKGMGKAKIQAVLNEIRVEYGLDRLDEEDVEWHLRYKLKGLSTVDIVGIMDGIPSVS